MSEAPKDELEGTEAPFVSHLIELRDRLIRSVFAIGIAFLVLCFFPGPNHLYDLLAAPLLSHLPQGTRLIATNVISPILVPLKVTLMAAFLIAHRRPGSPISPRACRRPSPCRRRPRGPWCA